MEIIKLFKSKWCLGVMGASGLVTYWVIKPQTTSLNLTTVPVWYVGILLMFVLLFSLSLACSVRVAKIKWQVQRQVAKKSFVSSLLYVAGLTTAQTCFIGGFCGVNLAVSVLAVILPSSLLAYFIHYSVWVLMGVNLGLIGSLWYMGCLSKKEVTGDR